jgi:hypothetical protein
MRNVCHEIKTQLRQQGSSDPCFCVCNFNRHCCASESSAWACDCEKSSAVRMESGFQSADRWQVCGDPRTGSPLRRLAASRAPCPNSVHSVLRGLAPADFNNSEHPTGVDLCVHCGVGFESDFSPPIGRVVDPRRAVATSTSITAIRPSPERSNQAPEPTSSDYRSGRLTAPAGSTADRSFPRAGEFLAGLPFRRKPGYLGNANTLIFCAGFSGCFPNFHANHPSPTIAQSTLAETRRLESLTFANVGFRLNFVP